MRLGTARYRGQRSPGLRSQDALRDGQADSGLRPRRVRSRAGVPVRGGEAGRPAPRAPRWCREVAHEGPTSDEDGEPRTRKHKPHGTPHAAPARTRVESRASAGRRRGPRTAAERGLRARHDLGHGLGFDLANNRTSLETQPAHSVRLARTAHASRPSAIDPYIALACRRLRSTRADADRAPWRCRPGQLTASPPRA